MLAVPGRACSIDLPECLGERKGAGVSAGIGNVFNGETGIFQEFTRLGHAVFDEKLLWRQVYSL